MFRKLLVPGSLLLAVAASLNAAEPKRLLVIGATAGVRHASIPNGEKMLRDLAARSNGQFTVTMLSDSPDYPFARVPGAGRGPVPGFAGQVPTARPAQQDALFVAGGPVASLVAPVASAQADLISAAFNQPSAILSKVDALAAAELKLALARAAAIEQVQSSPNRLSPEQLQALASAGGAGGGRGGRGGGAAAASAATSEALAKLFQEAASPASLARYDGVILLNSSGLLPFPDEGAFLRWVADGRAIVAIHAAMDTSYHTGDAYMDMLSGGGRYATSVGGSTTPRKVFRTDATHPASRNWPDGLAVADEIFQFTRANPADRNTNLPGIDRTRVRILLEADVDGERQPVSWVRMHGRGRVFYTSLGHRDDVLLPDVPAIDGGTKLNPNAVSAAYQEHLLQGIRWALGFAEGSALPGAGR